MADDPKPVLRLKSQKFREARQGEWRQLSRQLDKAEKQGLGSFSLNELLDLPVLYRSAMSSLSMARSISLDRNLITYLQTLCTRAYVNIYGPQTRLKDVLTGFFLKAWPQSVRKLWPEALLAFALVFGGAVAGWMMCAHDNVWFDTFLPPQMGQGRDLTATAAELKETMGHGRADEALSPFAVMLMTHNTKVAIATFALGALFGLPTFLLALYTGLQMGALVWLFARKGLGIDMAGWLSIHGTTEIFALIIASACGFHIARRLCFPGDATRQLALKEAGHLTGTAMIGVAIMLTIAGCLEGIGRQTITVTWERFLIGGAMLAAWLTYYGFTGRKVAAPKGEGG